MNGKKNTWKTKRSGSLNCHFAPNNCFLLHRFINFDRWNVFFAMFFFFWCSRAHWRHRHKLDCTTFVQVHTAHYDTTKATSLFFARVSDAVHWWSFGMRCMRTEIITQKETKLWTTFMKHTFALMKWVQGKYQRKIIITNGNVPYYDRSASIGSDFIEKFASTCNMAAVSTLKRF